MPSLKGKGDRRQAVEGFPTETLFTIFQLHATNEIDFSYFIILREQLRRFFQKGRSPRLVFSGFLSVFHTTNTIGAYTKIMLRKGHVTSSNRPAYTPMQDGIPNNPYIIAKNAPHPGAFFVAFFSNSHKKTACHRRSESEKPSRHSCGRLFLRCSVSNRGSGFLCVPDIFYEAEQQPRIPRIYNTICIKITVCHRLCL